jgi:hypothetical protein
MSFPAELAAIDAERRLHALSRRASLELLAANPPTWRVHGILSSEDYGVLAGPKGAGKTWCLCDLCVALALGERWLGHFPTERARVLLLSAEDGLARLWRRLDAVARSLGHDPEELEGWLYVHPLAFDAAGGLGLLEAELEEIRPGFAALDPAYRYFPGVRAQLFELGAVLTPVQQACQAVGASVLAGHHFNRRQDAPREERLSGAGLLEWARVVMTLEAPAWGTEAICSLEITGNNIEPATLRFRRRVEALSDGPVPELSYRVEVLAEGPEAVAARYATAAERVLAVLPSAPEEALTVREIGDRVAADATGKPLKAGTIRQVLHRELEGSVDSIGDGRETRWWRCDK